MKRICKAALYVFALAALLASGARAAAPSVTVGSIAVVGSTVTVNATAHGLAVNQGFCLSAPANVCGVVATSSANSFTFTMSAQSACASSCGTVQAAPQVIVLTTSPSSAGVTYNLLFWLTTQSPAATTATTQWKASNGSAGPTTAMSNALAAGYFIEIPFSRFEPAGISTAQLEADIQSLYAAEQSVFAGGAQPGTFYGFVFTPQGGWAPQ